MTIVSRQSLAQTHAWIDQSRSSLQKNVFVSQSLEGEYGRFEKYYSGLSSGESPALQSWRGYGVQNGMGIELFKFTQFSLSHTLLNLRSKESALENLNGSRLSAGVNFVFSAPIGNMEFGAGVNAARLDYQNRDKRSSLVGTGHHFTIGMNYFLSPSLSVFATGRRSESVYNHNGGQADIDHIRSNYDSLGIGVKIWF